MTQNNQNSEIIIFKTADEKVSVNVVMENETVWLTKDETLRKIGISDFSTKPTNYYNLDVIISVGYRVKSLRGTEFRKWATARLKEYIIKGFTMDDERLKPSTKGFRNGKRTFRDDTKRIMATVPDRAKGI